MKLPEPWYFTVDELAHAWGCHRDRVFYFMDAGLLVPSVLVAKATLPLELCGGMAPHVCFVLDGYRGLEWAHGAHGATAMLVGEFRAFALDGDGFASLHGQLAHPLTIARANLVVILEHREAFEATVAEPRERFNATERGTLLAIIRALAHAAYPDDARPYSIAAQVREAAATIGVQLSKEAVAQKIKEAFAANASDGDAKSSNVGSARKRGTRSIAGSALTREHLAIVNEGNAP